MTHTNGWSNRGDRVHARVLAEFVDMSALCSTSGTRRRRERERCQQVDQLSWRFLNSMEFGSGFASEQDAIQMLAPPVVMWIFGWVARQLAIAVIKALWREWHAEE